MLATIRFVHDGPSYSMCSITLVVFVTVIFLVSPKESCQLVDTGYFKMCVLPVSFLGFHLWSAYISGVADWWNSNLKEGGPKKLMDFYCRCMHLFPNTPSVSQHQVDQSILEHELGCLTRQIPIFSSLSRSVPHL